MLRLLAVLALLAAELALLELLPLPSAHAAAGLVGFAEGLLRNCRRQAQRERHPDRAQGET